MNIPQSSDFLSSPVAVKYISKKVLETLFRPGRNLRGIVTRDLGEGKFVFRVAKYNLVATSVKSMVVGQQVKVIVKQNKPKLHLQITPETLEKTSDAPIQERVSKEETTELPHLYLKGSEAEIIEELQIQDTEQTEQQEKNGGVAFILSMISEQAGQSRYQFNQTPESLHLDIYTDNFGWFQTLRSGLNELYHILQTNNEKQVFINIRMEAAQKCPAPATKSNNINLKI
ncbi:MAG: hypothetical protein DWQ05_14135 [Calditrichaeota bacterium]|nr:MAG: hypothetical protein DWQ05_14135 [Calditrichota bacterium]